MFYSVFHGIITELLTRGYNIAGDCLKKICTTLKSQFIPLKKQGIWIDQIFYFREIILFFVNKIFQLYYFLLHFLVFLSDIEKKNLQFYLEKGKEDINHVSKIRADCGIAIVHSKNCCGNTRINVRGGRPRNENITEDDLSQPFYRHVLITTVAHKRIFHLLPISPIHGHIWPYPKIQNLTLHY